MLQNHKWHNTGKILINHFYKHNEHHFDSAINGHDLDHFCWVFIDKSMLRIAIINNGCLFVCFRLFCKQAVSWRSRSDPSIWFLTQTASLIIWRAWGSFWPVGCTSWWFLLLVRPSLKSKTKSVFLSVWCVPVCLSVITELDGLAKGQDSREGVGNGAHARQVQDRARAAVMFLEKAFESRDPSIRALTSRGNTLESIAFRSEDTSGQKVCCFLLFIKWGFYTRATFFP